MISPSDTGSDPNLIRSAKLRDDAPSPVSVLPLEFEAIDHPLRRKTDWISNQDDGTTALNGQLREELTSLDSRFQMQTQQIAVQIAEARSEAKLEARQEWEAEFEERTAQERAQVTQICVNFTAERARYFALVEGEVVRLALAIAQRILHREAELDPLLLGAVVRMALEKVANDSGTMLHVPLADVDDWHALLSEMPEGAVRIIGEDRMNATECFIETTVGRVELGIAVQLEEVEKGFFDLLQQRPA